MKMKNEMSFLKLMSPLVLKANSQMHCIKSHYPRQAGK